MISCIICFFSLIMNIKIITIAIIIISRLHWLDHFIYTVKPWVSCSWTKKVSKNCYVQFCNKEDKEKAELQVTHRRCWGKCRGFKRQNFQPAQMYTLSSYETNAPHLCFFTKNPLILHHWSSRVQCASATYFCIRPLLQFPYLHFIIYLALFSSTFLTWYAQVTNIVTGKHWTLLFGEIPISGRCMLKY